MKKTVSALLATTICLSVSLAVLAGCDREAIASTVSSPFVTVAAAADPAKATALPERPVDEDGYRVAAVSELFWEPTEHGAIIIEYIGSDAYVTVPADVCGTPVIGVASNAFSGDSIRGIKVSDGIQQIQAAAFCGPSIEVVHLPASVCALDGNIFTSESSAVIIADSNTAAGKYAEDNGYAQ